MGISGDLLDPWAIILRTTNIRVGPPQRSPEEDMMPSAGKRLRALIEAPEILVLPGVFDGFSTRLVSRAGYRAAFITGSGVSESRLGQPDVGIMGLEENVAAARAIA